jgi:hypothetical protein
MQLPICKPTRPNAIKAKSFLDRITMAVGKSIARASRFLKHLKYHGADSGRLCSPFIADRDRTFLGHCRREHRKARRRLNCTN